MVIVSLRNAGGIPFGSLSAYMHALRDWLVQHNRQRAFGICKFVGTAKFLQRMFGRMDLTPCPLVGPGRLQMFFVHVYFS